MNQKKVLIFLQSGVGGAERVSVTIGKNLDSSKFAVVFYAVGPWENRIADFIPKDYCVHHLKFSNPIKILIEMKKVIRKEHPDIIFSSVMNLNTKLLILKRLFFKRLRFVVRSDNCFSVFTFKQKCLIRMLYNLADKIIAQTDEMADGLVSAGIHRNKIVVLQNPIDKTGIDFALKDSSSPYPINGCLHFVASGRFAEAKGFDILVSAFAEFKKKKTDVELFILGLTGAPENPVFQKIDQIVNDQGLHDSVHYVGFLGNPYPYIKYADCFVLSSRYEGLPNVLIEALYLGTPVAATTCIPIISRIVQEGVNGYLADVESISSLAIAMESACMLGRVKSTYESATINDFEESFFR